MSGRRVAAVARSLLAGLIAVILLFVACWSVRLGWADHLASGASAAELEEAVGLAEGNLGYLMDWADRISLEQGDPMPALSAAASACPLSPWPWIQLGIRSERRQNYAAAERYLLESARVSHDFEPRWALAGYWFRRGDSEQFWRWTRRALEVSSGDPVALFDLCWRFTGDESLIRCRAIPPRASVVTAYFRYLLSQNHLEAARGLAATVAQTSSPENTRSLVYYCGRMLAAGSVRAALEAWNALSKKGLIPYATLDPERGRVLTNGDLHRRPSGTGFDWSTADQPGISTRHVPGLLSFRFEGRQSGRIEILSQHIPLLPRQQCVLSCGLRTTGSGWNERLSLSILDPDGQVLAGAGPLRNSEFPGDATVRFRVPDGSHQGRVVVEYRRPPGSEGTDGRLEIRDVRLECAS